MTRHLPLAVDMDGCLIATDMLMEALAAALFEKPHLALAAPFWLARGGRPLLKRKLAAANLVDIAHVPPRMDLIGFLQAQKAAGRALHLVSASDQAAVDMVAAHLGLFDSATGSNGHINLKAAAKRRFLVERFPDGFVYAGDSRADLHVWPAAAAAIVAGAAPATLAALARANIPIEAQFPAAPASGRDWATLLGWRRLWLGLAGAATGPTLGWTSSLWAILAFSAAIAAGHILARLAGLKPDRRDPQRRTQPLAAGRIGLATAMQWAAILWALTIVASAFAVVSARGP